MSEFQETMGRLQEMISRNNELAEIKKEAGKIAFQKGLEQGRVEGAIKEINFWLNQLNDIHYCNDMHCEGAIFKNEIKERFEKRLKKLQQTDVCLSHKPSVCSMGGKE